jgi:hypothetical protein
LFFSSLLVGGDAEGVFAGFPTSWLVRVVGPSDGGTSPDGRLDDVSALLQPNDRCCLSS